jgi:hypothetical protein
MSNNSRSTVSVGGGGRVVALTIVTAMLLSVVAAPVLADNSPAPTDDEQINYTADSAPSVYAHADRVEIAEHDRASMSEVLEFYNDNGEAESLSGYGAQLNESRDMPIGVNLAKVKDLRYRTFPRISSEDGNGATWTNTGNWSTSSSSSGSMSVSDTTVSGANVSSVTFDVSAGSASEYGQATYDRVSITSDATKRVPQVGLNVDSLATDAVVQIRFEDSDGDYVTLAVNGSANPVTNESVIANETGEAFVAQERVSDLPIKGSGDGTFDGIEHVRVRGMDADSQIELFWLDAAKKSEEQLIDIERDTDSDGELETTGIVDKYDPGTAWTDSLDSLPTWSNDATIFDLKVEDLSFPLSEIPDDHNNITLSDHPTYDGGELDGSWRNTVPAMIDLSYTNLTLIAEQTAANDRYETVEYATDVGDTDFENVSYTDATGQFTDKGDSYILVSNLNAGEEYAVHVRQALTENERDSLENLAAMGGPTGSGAGGFFSSAFGKFVGVIGSIVGALGLGRWLGGGS